jgi:hypothetical protein
MGVDFAPVGAGSDRTEIMITIVMMMLLTKRSVERRGEQKSCTKNEVCKLFHILFLELFLRYNKIFKMLIVNNPTDSRNNSFILFTILSFNIF